MSKHGGKLLDVVKKLAKLDEDHTIYAVEPWTWESEACVAMEPDDEDIPSKASKIGAKYFIEVSIAKEFLEGWVESEGLTPSDRERCDRLIHYAIYDA